MREGIVKELDLTAMRSQVDNCFDKEARGASVKSVGSSGREIE